MIRGVDICITAYIPLEKPLSGKNFLASTAHTREGVLRELMVYYALSGLPTLFEKLYYFYTGIFSSYTLLSTRIKSNRAFLLG